MDDILTVALQNMTFFAIMGKRTFSDIETADESVQKDEQLEQHEEAKPKKKTKGLDLVSGGVNCKQTSAVLCVWWHQTQALNARPGEPLGRNAAQAVTDNVKRFATRRWKSGRNARPGKQNERSH